MVSKTNENEDIQKGKTTLNTWLDEHPEILEATSKDQLMDELLKDLKLPNLETLYQNLGNGNTGINSISNRINKIVFPGEISVDEDSLSRN